MPSFLSKVFGRKKDDQEHSSNGSNSLLEGKFEAVSPSVSPTAAKFADSLAKDKEKEKEKEFGFNLFKSKSHTTPSSSSATATSDFPHLSLNLSGGTKDDSNKNRRSLGVVFEADLDSQILLPDQTIAQRRLTPEQTTTLIRACARAITARGLESLGIMHPHWYSASPDVQKRLISLFIHPLAPNSPPTTLLQITDSTQSPFEAEVQFTRSPHDIAAVLRWGIRHLALTPPSFGLSPAWYTTFLESERSSQYPANAFSSILLPLLPKEHSDLLKQTLEIMSSLAAHTEQNGTSGSKLSKLFGLWLIALPRVEAEDDWEAFYKRWERAGRILEHLFLAHIRDESRTLRMPTRLTELVQRYPYTTTSSPNTEDLLPRPRFSTRTYTSLFVRIETQIPTSSRVKKDKFHPLILLIEALDSETEADSVERKELWEKLKTTVVRSKVNEEGESKREFRQLSEVFADETIRLLSVLPLPIFTDKDKEKEKEVTALIDALLPESAQHRKRAASSNEHLISNGNGAHVRASTDGRSNSTSPSSPTAAITTDWASFSSAGFLESSNIAPLSLSFLDGKDAETTSPSSSKKQKKAKQPLYPGRGRKSLDNNARSSTTPSSSAHPTERTMKEKAVSKATRASVIQLDEAFVDFWSDALLDPISSSDEVGGGPRFVVCKLHEGVLAESVVGDDNKNSTANAIATADEKKKGIEWLVLEQVYATTPKPKPPTPTSSPSKKPSSTPAPAENASSKPRASSPRPSFKSDLSGTFSATRKRFSIFTASRSNSRQSGDAGTPTSPVSANATKGGKAGKGMGIGKGKKEKGVKVGEMGEILAEEKEPEEGEKEKEKEQGKGKKEDVVKVRVPSPKPKRKSVDANTATSTGAALVAAAVGATVGGAAVAAADAAVKEPQTEAVSEKVELSADEAAPALPPKTEAILPELVPADIAAALAPQTEPVAELSVKDNAEPTETKKVEEAPVKEYTQSEPIVASPPESAAEPVVEPTPEPAAEEDPQPETITASEPAVAAPEPAAEPVAEAVVLEDAVPVPANPEEPEAAKDETVPVPTSVAEPEPLSALLETAVVEEPVKEELQSAQTTELDVAAAAEPDAEAVEPAKDEEPADTVPEPTPESVITALAEPIVEPTVELPTEPEVVAPNEDESASTELADVPIVESEPIVRDRRASIEPIHTESDKASERSTHSVAHKQEQEADPSTSLPPAPESVVLAGETPGPQLALSSSEPAAIAHASESEEDGAKVEVAEDVQSEGDKGAESETHPNGNGVTPAPNEPVQDTKEDDEAAASHPGDVFEDADKQEEQSPDARAPTTETPHVGADGASPEEKVISEEKEEEPKEADHEGNGVVQPSAQAETS